MCSELNYFMLTTLNKPLLLFNIIYLYIWTSRIRYPQPLINASPTNIVFSLKSLPHRYRISILYYFNITYLLHRLMFQYRYIIKCIGRKPIFFYFFVHDTALIKFSKYIFYTYVYIIVIYIYIK